MGLVGADHGVVLGLVGLWTLAHRGRRCGLARGVVGVAWVLWVRGIPGL